jgi:hypothetical protein
LGHYAKVLNDKVVDTMVAEPEFFDTFVDSSPGEWIQISYNSRGNVHYLPNSNTPSGLPALRANYAGIGDIYDRQHDVFHHPQPFPSWSLNTSTWLWEPPTPFPTETATVTGKNYNWNEATTSWVEHEL